MAHNCLKKACSKVLPSVLVAGLIAILALSFSGCMGGTGAKGKPNRTYAALKYLASKSDTIKGLITRHIMTRINGEDLDDDGDKTDREITHAQGELAGEVTANSVILQSRLTAGKKLIEYDIPGAPGMACFEIASSPDFNNALKTDWLTATAENDFIIKTKVNDLRRGTRYYYRLLYGKDAGTITTGNTCAFNTLAGKDVASEVSFVVVTGMQYVALFVEKPKDSRLGFPALESILRLEPDFLIATGDNVYYDIFPLEATTQAELRAHWHRQFVKPRFVKLFSQVPIYWEKDDHDHRYNDCDTAGNLEPSSELGIKTFLEQAPVVDPEAEAPVTYRTHQINKLLQIWLTEGRDYRSPNVMEDGPEKTLWGKEQKEWLKKTLLESDATFKLLVSPTPLIGPDDSWNPTPTPGQNDTRKRDNHSNPGGFKYEGDEFFGWLKDNGFLDRNFAIACGDRHWQYHSIRPDGFEEFSCGAIVDGNSRLGRVPGDPQSTDPEGRIRQPYTQKEQSGGFLLVKIRPGEGGGEPTAEFTFYDDEGIKLYSHTKIAK